MNVGGGVNGMVSVGESLCELCCIWFRFCVVYWMVVGIWLRWCKWLMNVVDSNCCLVGVGLGI